MSTRRKPEAADGAAAAGTPPALRKEKRAKPAPSPSPAADRHSHREPSMADSDAESDASMGEFEDDDVVDAGDHIDDDVVVDAGDDDEDDLDEDAMEDGKPSAKLGDLDLDDNEEEEEEGMVETFLPGRDQLEEGEVLEADPTAYDMLHALNVEWPCLSFDVVRDELGDQRITYPMTAYVVTGTQADQAHSNKVLIMKMSQLAKTRVKDDEDDEEDGDKVHPTHDDSDEEEDDVADPRLEYRFIRHQGGVNRIRTMPQVTARRLAATWADTGKVHVWDITSGLNELDGRSTPGQAPFSSFAQPVFTFAGHTTEGFALDWSPSVAGRLLTGDCNSGIHLWNMNNATGTWTVGKTYQGHTASVEDLQWSPVEKDVFASCSVDRSIKIWDARKRGAAALSVEAHTTDVNVISWNPTMTHLLVSGADDGTFSVWDLRNFKPNSAAATFRWHTDAITSVEWHPTDESVLAVSGADDQLTLWDLSLEKDTEADAVRRDVAEVPAQLLFIHQGQTHIKELHWHRQLPGVIISTAYTGFNIFKTISA